MLPAAGVNALPPEVEWLWGRNLQSLGRGFLHEISSPLTAILWNAEYLGDSPGAPESVRATAREIGEAAGRCRAAIEAIRVAYRSELTTPRPVRANDCVLGAMKLLETEFRHWAVEAVVDTDPRSPLALVSESSVMHLTAALALYALDRAKLGVASRRVIVGVRARASDLLIKVDWRSSSEPSAGVFDFEEEVQPPGENEDFDWRLQLLALAAAAEGGKVRMKGGYTLGLFLPALVHEDG